MALNAAPAPLTFTQDRACPRCDRSMADQEHVQTCDFCGSQVGESCLVYREVRQASHDSPAEYATACCSCRAPDCSCTADPDHPGYLLPCNACLDAADR